MPTNNPLGIIVIVFSLFAMVYYWKQGHSGFWKELNKKYKTTKPNGNIIPRVLRYRKPEAIWQRWNMFAPELDSQGLHLKSLFTSFIYPSVYIPWEKVTLLREEKFGLRKSGVIVIEDVPGEIAIPYTYISQIKQYAR
ncbi:MAG: hypothetical protein KBT63_04765 [Porticoccaceae bacterium]|nr:hypothetical protein [Porticoccaceae bacterium]